MHVRHYLEGLYWLSIQKWWAMKFSVCRNNHNSLVNISISSLLDTSAMSWRIKTVCVCVCVCVCGREREREREICLRSQHSDVSSGYIAYYYGHCIEIVNKSSLTSQFGISTIYTVLFIHGSGTNLILHPCLGSGWLQCAYICSWTELWPLWPFMHPGYIVWFIHVHMRWLYNVCRLHEVWTAAHTFHCVHCEWTQSQ